MGARGWIEKKLVWPLKEQLKQCSHAEGLAKSAATGAVFSIIPVLSVSTWICVAVAHRFKLNQVVVQIFNYLFYPFQFILIPVFMSLGAWATGAPDIRFDLRVVITQLRSDPKDVLAVLGMAWAKGVVVWAITAPLVFIVIYWISYFIFSRVMQKRAESADE